MNYSKHRFEKQIKSNHLEDTDYKSNPMDDMQSKT